MKQDNNPEILPDTQVTLQELKTKIAEFIKERDWNQFHTPKNLSMGIATEASELMELFLWVESNKSLELYKKQEQAVQEELADIIMFALCFANATGIDIASAVESKMRLNAQKYPVETSKGKCSKYDGSIRD